MVTQNAYYSSAVDEFLTADPAAVLGQLTASSQFGVGTPQAFAWREQIALLKRSLIGVSGAVFLEFTVPRIGTRIDAVLISGPAVLVLEFKVGQDSVNRADLNQVWDYALDLKNFHGGTRDAPVVPILVATESKLATVSLGNQASDGVFTPIVANASTLRGTLRAVLNATSGATLNPSSWARASYSPTPTIVDAARALYSQHSVDSIARNDAGASNLRITSARIEELVTLAKQDKRKIIVFVTGVPGAGKTLVGLNIATMRRPSTDLAHAVYLSGNGPLVNVLREALTSDEVARASNRCEGDLPTGQRRVRKGDVEQSVKAFIQNVHHFLNAGMRDAGPPADHVVIFDEAQRAWDRPMTADFMRRKRGIHGFDFSEPEFLIGYVDRHQDWAVIVCLVGGGQEINRGEAGIGAWIEAVRNRYPHWQVHISPELKDAEYAAGSALNSLSEHPSVTLDASLHLSVSMRSFRAEHVASFVKAALDRNVAAAASALVGVSNRYPIAVTRDLGLARDWVRGRARGSERYGLVATSGARRLKPHAIDVRTTIDPVNWFLKGPSDVRSSFYLEDVATEFHIQGLELDWVCVSWDADLRWAPEGWVCKSFAGTRWSEVSSASARQYLINSYRVLLTRARQGMVIFVPPGDNSDHTRRCEFYDPTFDYLARLGVPVLEQRE